MSQPPAQPALGFELPLVSVVVVNYNYARFVAAAIESVFAQSYPNIECVALDNRSTDDSLAVLADLQRRFPQLRVIERSANEGQAVASVEGFEATHGPYVVLFDADDVMLPDFVATHVATHLSLRIPVGFSCSDMFQTVGAGLVLGTFAPLNDYVRSGVGLRDDLVRPVDTSEPALPLAPLPAVEPGRVHYVAPRQSDWVWASMSAFMFRRDALNLVIGCAALKGLMTNFDVFVTRGLNVLTGSVVIDRTLTVYRMHDANIFVRHPHLDGCFNFARGGRYDEEQTARRMLIDHLLDSLPDLAAKIMDRRRLLDAIRTLDGVNPALRAGEGEAPTRPPPSSTSCRCCAAPCRAASWRCGRSRSGFRRCGSSHRDGFRFRGATRFDAALRRRAVSASPKLSIVVVTYEMRREAYRTVFSLTRGQVGVDAADYEIIVVDNGSREPVDAALFESCGANVRVVAAPTPSVSPAAALNHGASLARGDIVVSMIDGARMASPGCVHWTMEAFRLSDRAVAIVPSWHVGPHVQNKSVAEGYNQTVEDELFDTVEWRSDGYRLFDISRELDPSSAGAAWFGPLWESNYIGLHRDDYERLGGFDPAFASRGGGMVNLDFFARACDELGCPVVSLIGEGTFHQVHGGVSTNVSAKEHPWEVLNAEYSRIRGREFRKPDYVPVQLGRLGSHAGEWLATHHDILARASKPDTLRGRVRQAAAMLMGRS